MTADALSPEQRLAELETTVSALSKQILFVTARSFALQELLSERGLLARDDVIARMDAMEMKARESVELLPQWEGFRGWRRHREADVPAPDDQSQ